MIRRAIALRLAALVALSGLLPIVLLAAVGLQILKRRGEQASTEALTAIAAQASARIGMYIAQQRETLRALAMAVGSEPDAARRLADVTLDAPSLGRLRLIDAQTPAPSFPPALRREQIARALAGTEVASETYIRELSPAMDVCVPSGKLAHAVCATLDLLELQRQVQRIRVGQSGYALAFDRSGRLLAAGSGKLRAAVLSGEPVPESAAATQLARSGAAPSRLAGEGGADVLAGWSFLPDLGWSIAVEQPAAEALRGAREALVVLGLGALAALVISLVAGSAIARRMLATLEAEARWRTAGRIASGLSHDLGHRLAILKQIEQLAATNDAEYLPRIRDSLAAEVETLRKFVADFADLTRTPKPDEFMPVELNAFVQSVGSTAEEHGQRAQVAVEAATAPGEIWVRGDRYLLERATLNLVYNAIEASPPGSRVRLSVRQENGRALLTVEDRGQGIAEDRLETLFDSFNSTKRTGVHVGMGLPNVRRIVLAHSGEVSVKSRLGQGSEFTLALPAHSSSSSS